MNTGLKSSWGGKRKGAGRPRKNLSVFKIMNVMQIAEIYAEKYERTAFEILLEIIYMEQLYGDPISIRDKIAAIKIVLKIIMRCPDESAFVVAPNEPSIWLPERQPDPAKLIDEKKH